MGFDWFHIDVLFNIYLRLNDLKLKDLALAEFSVPLIGLLVKPYTYTGLFWLLSFLQFVY